MCWLYLFCICSCIHRYLHAYICLYKSIKLIKETVYIITIMNIYICILKQNIVKYIHKNKHNLFNQV